jgi:hypothetical protein
MRPVLLAALVLAVFAACQSSLRSMGQPTVTDSLVSSAAVGQTMQLYQSCQHFKDHPLSFPAELQLGATAVMHLVDYARQSPGGPDGGVALAGPWLGLTEQELGDIDRDLNLLGKGLAAFSGRPGLPWVFGVIDLERPLFFSAGGGVVFVTTGLLARVENEAQLALVLMLGITHVGLRRDAQALQDGLFAACVSDAFGQELEAALRPGRDSPLDMVSGATYRKVSHVMFTHLLAQRTAEYDGEVVDTAVWTLAFAGYQPLEGARLLEGLPVTRSPWGLDARVAEQVRVLGQHLQDSFRLSAPPSKAAELVRRRVPAP